MRTFLLVLLALVATPAFAHPSDSVAYSWFAVLAGVGVLVIGGLLFLVGAPAAARVAVKIGLGTVVLGFVAFLLAIAVDLAAEPAEFRPHTDSRRALVG